MIICIVYTITMNEEAITAQTITTQKNPIDESTTPTFYPRTLPSYGPLQITLNAHPTLHNTLFSPSLQRYNNRPISGKP